MISVAERIRLGTPPARVWALLGEMDRHYTAWHPDHRAWRWVRGEPLSPGSVWFADERIGRLRIRGRFHVVGSEPARLLAYRTGPPGSLVRAGGSFRLEEAPGESCDVTQEVHLGFDLGPLGVLDRLLALAVPPDDLRRHMREEQANLPRLLAGAE